MSTEVEKFEAVRSYFWKCSADFCLIYSQKEGGDPDLKWRSATSWRFKTRDDCETFAARYRALATYYYQRKRDKIFEEIIDPQTGAWTSIGLGTTKFLRTLLGTLEPFTTPANTIGQRWWQLVIGSGATRNAGYVIIARVAAQDEKEMRKYITDIQAIMENRAIKGYRQKSPHSNGPRAL